MRAETRLIIAGEHVAAYGAYSAKPRISHGDAELAAWCRAFWDGLGMPVSWLSNVTTWQRADGSQHAQIVCKDIFTGEVLVRPIDVAAGEVL
jgi:hypothetical protein